MAKGRLSVKAEAGSVFGQRAVIVAKGVIRGTVWGLVLGSAGVVSASLVAPQPAGNTPPARPLVEVPVTAEVATPEVTAPEATVSTEETTATATPQVATPVETVTAPLADSTPLEVPETPDIGVTLDLPDAPEVPDIALADEEPVLPNPQSLAPQVPANEGDLVIETAPAVPVAVEPEPEEVLVVETPPAVEAEVAAVEESPPAEIIDTSPDRANQVTDTEVIAPNDAEAETPTEVAGDVTQEADSVEEIAMADVSETATQPPVEPAGDVPADVPDTAPAEIAEEPSPEVLEALPEETPEPLEEPDDAPQAPVVVSIIDDAPTSSLPQGSGGVKVNRVVGSQPVAEPEPAPETEVVPTDGPALQVHAAAFENPEGKPLMALILLDDPSFAEAPRALADVPFSVTVLIDPTAEGASARMAEYRAQGIELGVALRLPEGARPSDVEVALEASFASLPETVVLADLGDSDRAAKDQMLAALSQEGRGFVSFSSGLNSGLRAANAAGVPAVEIFRDLDAEDQNARVIRRFLDQAAFRARQNSGVVVVGRMRADTLSALILWGTANRAGQVAMAPVSALMTRE